MNSTRALILCATDFSDRANAAATVAAKIALHRTEPLQLVHVCTDLRNSSVAARRRRLEREAVRLRQVGTAVETRLLEASNPSDALVAHVATESPALVVLAAGIKGPLDRWALGSFAERIAEASPVPTLVVRDPQAFEEWDWTKSRLRVLAALDLSASSDVVLRWIKQMGRTGPWDVVPCHVNFRVPPPAEADTPGRLTNPPSLQRRLERDLKKKVRDQLGDDAANVIVKPNFGEPGPALIETAREVKAHLIVVGTHQRRGLRRLARFSVSRELLHASPMNVVCVPVTARFDPRDTHIPDFRRVLVATDFSDLGDAAVPFACGACALGGVLRLVHVVRPGGGARARPALRERLRGLVPLEMAARGQPVECEVLESREVAAAICDEAERFGADLVCLASHGLGASRALHGSVTKAVLKQIRRPLLVIRRPDE